MAQYCRYCSNLIVGDIAWCMKKKKEIPEYLAKTTNYCAMYDLCTIDAYGENLRGYKPRRRKKEDPEGEQIDGQVEISDFLAGL